MSCSTPAGARAGRLPCVRERRQSRPAGNAGALSQCAKQATRGRAIKSVEIGESAPFERRDRSAAQGGAPVPRRPRPGFERVVRDRCPLLTETQPMAWARSGGPIRCLERPSHRTRAACSSSPGAAVQRVGDVHAGGARCPGVGARPRRAGRRRRRCRCVAAMARLRVAGLRALRFAAASTAGTVHAHGDCSWCPGPGTIMARVDSDRTDASSR